ncbi:Hypothetical protein AT6N2_L2362 [Agrobacterium tumefaciens]|nr:Hypothetical protein AT6N2_L2362 [Agrobacterium tumefaciens]
MVIERVADSFVSVGRNMAWMHMPRRWRRLNRLVVSNVSRVNDNVTAAMFAHTNITFP